MSADPPAALGRKPRPGPLDIFGAVTLGLVLFNAALLFTGSFPPVTGVQVFYWQRYNSLLYWLRFWGVILRPRPAGGAAMRGGWAHGGGQSLGTIRVGR